jgi:hypothetical protein
MDAVAAQPPVPRNRVGADFFECVPVVRIAIGIVDGGGEIEFSQLPFARA